MNLVSRCELRNKRSREEVAKGYYEVRLLFFCPVVSRKSYLLFFYRLILMSTEFARWHSKVCSEHNLTRPLTRALSTGVELQQANVMDCSLLVGIHNLYF